MLLYPEPLSQDLEFKYNWCLGNTHFGIKRPSVKPMSLSTTGPWVIHAVVSRAPSAKAMSLSTTGAWVIHAVVSRAPLAKTMSLSTTGARVIHAVVSRAP